MNRPDAGNTGQVSRSRLVVLGGAQMTTFRLPPDGDVTIGRAADCLVRVDHASLGERHASLRMGKELVLIDLASGSPTTVAGMRVAAGARVPISHGIILTLGAVQMSLQTSGMSIAIEHVGSRHLPSILPQGPLDLRPLIERVGASMIGVLILGETGVGKEVMASAIHAASSRASKPFLRLNCAAFAETLLESELFGFERGAFTGAVQSKAGLLESAEGGTVLLDEVGEMPLSLQAKLLRVIEQKQVTRLGGLSPRPLDVRFLAATNRDLESDVERGTFRRDMYFRLNGFSIVLPPLRERVGEIRPLSLAFIEQVCAQMGRLDVPRLAPDALETLERYAWPGNIRELRNVIERALVLCSRATIERADLPLDRMERPAPAVAMELRTADPVTPPPDGERERIVEALERSAGNQTKAAQFLGYSRGTLIARIERYGLRRPKKREQT